MYVSIADQLERVRADFQLLGLNPLLVLPITQKQWYQKYSNPT
jgi:hypothetical protein